MEIWKYVALYKDKVRKNKQVHRLVAEAFIKNDENQPLINHKDGGAVKRGERNRGRTAWNKGKTMPESFKQKVSDGMKNYYRGRLLG